MHSVHYPGFQKDQLELHDVQLYLRVENSQKKAQERLDWKNHGEEQASNV
jgi:hypothetical protein